MIIDLDPFTGRAVANEGFGHFLLFRDLDLATVPRAPGVYMLRRAVDAPPGFLERSRGGHLKGKNPTVDPALLAARWIDRAQCIYIGMTRSDLRTRLRDFRNFGAGRPVGHWGGRYAWQLADADAFEVAWKAVAADTDPRDAERRLIEQFERLHGGQPFANIAR